MAEASSQLVVFMSSRSWLKIILVMRNWAASWLLAPWTISSSRTRTPYPWGPLVRFCRGHGCASPLWLGHLQRKKGWKKLGDPGSRRRVGERLNTIDEDSDGHSQPFSPASR